MSISSTSPVGAKRSKKKHENGQRVILLLDMDCFYAQCESVRLGLDPQTPLALIQWNSALAVSYPARKYGIVRGDSFEKIHEKSKGECVCIHLPVTTLNDSASPKKGQETSNSEKDVQNDGENDNSAISSEENVKESFDAEFNQPPNIQEEMYKREKNRMVSRNEGKACLNRYRLASSRIFSLIDETLSNSIGKKNYILERASIDELFIDVSSFCNNPESVSNDDNEEYAVNDVPRSIEMQFRSTCVEDATQSLKETVICHENTLHPYEEIKVEKALVMGCHIARTVRRAVFQELRFTLSAGISTSKLVAKLGATYGKPNGQAVIFPGAIMKVMDETPIKKARMLGGKLGKKVLSLLPESEATMGSISRLLTLDDLVQGIGQESGKWVFDACRGICTEEVKSTLNVLPKSITAFKSFSGVGYPELEKWTVLLAGDIMKRVELDTARNNRAPKSCTLGYTTEWGGPWIGRSIRLPFPTDRDFDSRVKRLVDQTRKVLVESGQTTIIRLGYSAIDFVTRPAKGIETFFNADVNRSPTKQKKIESDRSVKKKHPAKPSGIETFFSCSKNEAISTQCTSSNNEKSPRDHTVDRYNQPLEHSNQIHITGVSAMKSDSANVSELRNIAMSDEEIARQLQSAYDNEVKTGSPATMTQPKTEVDRDEAIALKLQSTYDREHAVLSCVEKFSIHKRRDKRGKVKGNDGTTICKKSKIDSYFTFKK